MIVWEKYRPILVVPAVPIDNGIRFLCQTHQIDVNGEIAITLWKLLSLCNGYRTAKEIVGFSGIKESLVKKIFTELSELHIILDSCEQYKHFHKISDNPMTYFYKLTQNEIEEQKKTTAVKCPGEKIEFTIDNFSSLYQLQVKRESCRSFSHEKLTLFQIGNICDFAYSRSRHATPSGGGLYPLRIFCIVVRDQIGIGSGYYEYDSENSQLILFNNQPDIEQLKYCYNDEKLAFNSPVQIVVAADLERQTAKYSNRGYRFTLIEAGQAAQNLTLYCEEQGLSTCELGGFNDEALAIEMNIGRYNLSPLLTIAVGYKSNLVSHSYIELLNNLEKHYVGDEKIVHSYGVNTFDCKNSSFYGTWARYGEHNNRISGATGTSYYESCCKAIIEAYERHISSVTRVDYFGVAKETDSFFTPEQLAPLSIKQRELLGLQPYRSDSKIEWTVDVTGKYYLPTDFVYYGHNKKGKLFKGDSSGIAAHTDFEEAKKHAVAELIERDSIMRLWYEHRAPKHLSPDFLPFHVRKKADYWKNKGRNVHVLDLESPHLPTFLVVIESEEYPCFVSGAATALTNNIDSAVIKAFQEAEYNLLLALKNPFKEPPQIENIHSPIDHGRYYHFLSNARKIDWLWSNNENAKNTYNQKYDIDSIIGELEIIFVDMSTSKKAFIKVVRAVSRKMIPISFGYKSDYYLHPEVKKLVVQTSLEDYEPHFFA